MKKEKIEKDLEACQQIGDKLGALITLSLFTVRLMAQEEIITPIVPPIILQKMYEDLSKTLGKGCPVLKNLERIFSFTPVP
ncbi:MAG TPA: hypothetical protein PKZ16_00710 [bacterium]|nr:hypothetical protein [bacterium]HPL95407.1 hypothetical protein [bacterium]